MKDKFKEKYLPEYYKNRLLDKLNDLCQGNLLVQVYVDMFDDLFTKCDIREDPLYTVAWFCYGLRLGIKKPNAHTV